MNYIDAVNQLHTHCPLCDHPLSEPRQLDPDDHDKYWVTCDVCKTYAITDEVFRFAALTADLKPLLSAIVRRHFDFTRRPETITTVTCKELASQVPEKNDVPSKVRYLLGYIARKSTFPGERVVLNSQTDYPVCFAANSNEFEFYAWYAKEMSFIEVMQEGGGSGVFRYRLTPKGWEETRRAPTLDSPYGFVAMSFSKDNPLLAQAFDKAIKPAIEDDAGYMEALRVDRKEFLGDIVFEIIARIKESRFLVADATEHKNGVYFEAGYAMGMGLPVIWMCHEEDIKLAHFDTSHLNHIVWNDVGELRKNLANRILATIGRGPRRGQT